MPQSVKLGSNVVVEIISAYAATNQQLSAVAAPPAWYVVGGFWMPREASVSLELIGVVTLAGLAMKARLFDVAAALPVSGSETAEITSTTDARAISGAFLLPGNKLYQMQVQVIGDTDEFGIVRTAALF